jgi:hypothetical protein
MLQIAMIVAALILIIWAPIENRKVRSGWINPRYKGNPADYHRAYTKQIKLSFYLPGAVLHRAQCRHGLRRPARHRAHGRATGHRRVVGRGGDRDVFLPALLAGLARQAVSGPPAGTYLVAALVAAGGNAPLLTVLSSEGPYCHG